MYRNLRAAAITGTLICFAAAAQDSSIPLAIVAAKGTPEMAARWWQWAMSGPKESNPVKDLTGEHCAVGQTEDIWFLAGGFGSSKIRRTCIVPAGRSLFFPLVNMVYWSPRDATKFTCDRAKQLAALNNDTALDLFAEIDGEQIPNLKKYRVATQDCFNVFARIPPTQHSYNAYPSATDGYWLLLEPLPVGRHVLKFGGKYNRQSEAYGRMVQDIEYELIVK